MFDENDVKVVKGGGPTVKFLSDASATAINQGEPVKLVTKYAGLLADGDPEVGTDLMLGVTHKASTHTSTVDGVVEVTTLLPMRTVLRWNATATTTVNTQALIDAMLNDWKTCGLSGTTFTIDEAESDDSAVHGFGIIGGDPKEYTLDVFVQALVTFAAPNA